jgi:hypothetical protein
MSMESDMLPLPSEHAVVHDMLLPPAEMNRHPRRSLPPLLTWMSSAG